MHRRQCIERETNTKRTDARQTSPFARGSHKKLAGTGIAMLLPQNITQYTRDAFRNVIARNCACSVRRLISCQRTTRNRVRHSELTFDAEFRMCAARFRLSCSVWLDSRAGNYECECVSMCACVRVCFTLYIVEQNTRTHQGPTHI